MDDQQQAVAREKIRQNRILALPADDFLHRVADGFQTIEPANLPDDSWLIGADVDLPAVQHPSQFEEAESADRPESRAHQ